MASSTEVYSNNSKDLELTDVETNPTHSLHDSDEEGLLVKFDRVFAKAKSTEKVCFYY